VTVSREFQSVEGHSYFGDLFLRDPRSGEYAILLNQKLELVASGELERSGFRQQILENSDVVAQVLRPADLVTLMERLGEPGEDVVFFPVPLPCLGGSAELRTYDRGGMWEYLAIVAQSLALADDRPTRQGRRARRR
jgi:hypothetical protein